jgi:lipid A 4'-phosphatase
MRAIMPIEQSVTSDTDADGLTELKLAAIAALIGVAAAVIFVGWPELDLSVARLFYVEPRNFLFTQSTLATILRVGFRLLTWGTAVAAVAGIVLVLARKRHLLGLGLPQWTFLALVLITGPGLIANTVLKDNWARPRPLYVTEFGGPDRFTTVLERTGSCERNCSFVSGEASATFALGFAFALLARRRRDLMMAAGVAAGSLAGLIRMGEGGHFLSDVVFAGVFMALDVALIHWLVFQVLMQRMPDEAWWHAKTVAVTEELRRQYREAVATSTAWLRQTFPEIFARNLAPRNHPDGEEPPP